MEPNQNLLDNELQIDSIAGMHLKETAMWAKIISIAGFIISVFIFLIAIFAGSMLARMGSRYGTGVSSAGLAGAVGIVYGIIAVIYFVCSLFQYRFATKLKEALSNNDQEQLNYSLQNLKSYYRITGVLTILGVIFFALGLLGMLIGLSSGGY